MKKSLKRAVVITGFVTAAILVLAAIAMAAGFMFIRQGPASVAFLLPYLSQYISSEVEGVKISAEGARLGWNSEHNAFFIQASKLNAVDAADAPLVNIESLTLMPDFSGLFHGKLVIRQLELHQADVFVRQQEGNSRFSMERQQLLTALAGKAEVNADGVRLHYGEGSQAVRLSVEQFRSAREGDTLRGSGQMALESINPETSQRALIAVNFSTHLPSDVYQAVVKLENIYPPMLAGISPALAQASEFQAVVAGTLETKGHIEYGVESLGFDITAGEGKLDSPEHFEGPLHFSSLVAKGVLTERLRVLAMEQMNVSLLEEAQLSGRGNMVFSPGRVGFDLRLDLLNFNMDRLTNHWPRKLEPKIRQWVTHHITGGRVPQAYVKLKYSVPTTPGAPHEAIPEDGVESEINAENVKVAYHEGMLPVDQASGKVFITGKKLDITVNQAKTLSGTTISQAALLIPDMQAPHPAITITLAATSPVRDIATYLSSPFFKLDTALKIKPDAVAGMAELGVVVTVPLSHPSGAVPQEAVRYAIRADVKDAVLPGLLGKYDISQGNGEFRIEDFQGSFAGQATMRGIPMALTWQGKDLHHRERLESRVTAQITTDATQAARAMNTTALSAVRGPLKVNVELIETPSTMDFTAQTDLTATELSFPPYLHKPAGKPATLALKGGQHTSGGVNLREFSLEGEGLKAAGMATLNEQFTLTSLEASTVQMGEQRLAGSYTRVGEQHHKITITGAQLDARPWLDDKSEPGTATTPTMDISINVEQAIGAEGLKLGALKAEFSCIPAYCTQGSASGTLSEGKRFSLALTPDNSGAKLTIKAEDAGALLRWMDLYSNMKGGVLDVTGTYQNQPGRPLQGTVSVREFSVIKAPVLAKLVSLASITGIADGLNDTGISFTRLESPFTMAKQGITFGEAKCAGPSIGLTASGKFDRASKALDVKGTLIPAYGLNTLLGKAPIVGAVLTGGKDKGVFAANFSVKGSASDPQVTVNPLSIVTPGFLRGIFDVFQGEAGEGAVPDKAAPAYPNETPR